MNLVERQSDPISEHEWKNRNNQTIEEEICEEAYAECDGDEELAAAPLESGRLLQVVALDLRCVEKLCP